MVAGIAEGNANTQDFSIFTPSCDAARGSRYSACITWTISQAPSPYAGMGLVFHPGAFKYDLSRWQAVSFYVSGFVGPSSQLLFEIPQAADTMVGVGSGTCTDRCGDSYQVPVPGFEPGVDHGWTKQTISFASLRQSGRSGDPEPWDPKTVISLQWTVNAMPPVGAE